MMYEEAENKWTIKENLAIAEPEAPQTLQENKETFISPLGKESTTVVLQLEDYDNKLHAYTPRVVDPTTYLRKAPKTKSRVFQRTKVPKYK